MHFGQTFLSLGVVFALTFKKILNNIVMTQIHVVIRRINPAFKIDLVQVGYIENGQFTSLSLDALERTPISTYVEHSSIADSPYIEHSSVFSLVDVLRVYPNFDIEFFDNTLVLMFDFDLSSDESASQEEGKGN